MKCNSSISRPSSNLLSFSSHRFAQTDKLTNTLSCFMYRLLSSKTSVLSDSDDMIEIRIRRDCQSSFPTCATSRRTLNTIDELYSSSALNPHVGLLASLIASRIRFIVRYG
jgi:hypothetical protein